jgi:single-strand DNA-binding protein
MATNRTWVTEGGDKKEETEFHRIVAWNKLAELCSQLLFKGRRIYVEGRLQTRQWTAPDGAARVATEIVIEDMILLDSKRQGDEGGYEEGPSDDRGSVALEEQVVEVNGGAQSEDQAKKSAKPSASRKKGEEKTAADVADDIPF